MKGFSSIGEDEKAMELLVESSGEENALFEGGYVDVSKLEGLAMDLEVSDLFHQEREKPRGIQGAAKTVLGKIRVLRQINEGESDSLLSDSAARYDSEDDASDIRSFVTAFGCESEKVDSCYQKHTRQLRERFEALLSHIEQTSLAASKPKEMVAEEITAEFVYLYRQAHFVDGFSVTNYTRFVSLLQLKKVSSRYWKRKQNFVGPALLHEVVYQSGYAKSKEIRQLIANILKTFAELRYKGNEKLANFRLLEKKRDNIDWDTVLVGAWIGASVTSLLWSIYTISKEPADSPHATANAGGVRIFRFVGLCLLMFWGLCTQLAIWRESRVNFAVIFGFPASWFPSTSTVFLFAARFSVVYLLCLIAFVETRRSEDPSVQIQAGYIPIILLCVFLAVVTAFWVTVFFVPLLKHGTFLQALRVTIYTRLAFVFGLSDRSFLIAYICDYLTSSSKILADLAHIICQLSSLDMSAVRAMTEGSEYCANDVWLNHYIVPVIMMWPLWLRLAQNLSGFYVTHKKWPFLYNAGKYALAHTIVIFSALHPELMTVETPTGSRDIWRVIFLGSFVLISFLTYLWDVFVDWKLGSLSHRFLRQRLMLPYNWFYYVAIVADFFGRYLWALTLVTNYWLLSGGVATALEVVRRSFWGVIRVENEHLNNTRNYRNVNFIPLYFDTPVATKGKDKVVGHSITTVVIEIVAFVAAVLSLAVMAIYY